MESKVVQGILKANLDSERKLQLIAEIYNLMTAFEAFSERKPHKGLEAAAEEFASYRGIKRKTPDKQHIKAVLRKGIKWLIKNQHEDGGWGWIQEKRFSPLAWKKWMECNREGSSSLPWDTAVAILALNDWGKAIHEQDTRALVKSGLEWLVRSQKEDGGWGGLIWVGSESPSNAVETGASLWVFCLASPEGFEKRDITNKGLQFLTRLQHKHGGYSLQPSLRADTKSTAISTAIHHCYEKNLERIPSSVTWLLEKQTSEGNWTWLQDTYGQINATFYAIEALRIHYLQWEEAKVLEPIARAVNWYEAAAHLVVEEEKVGWAWEGAENTAAAVIALLDSGAPDSSPIIERGIEWLIAQHDPRHFWGYETPLVLLALIRYLEPKSRIESVIKDHTTGIRA